MTPNPPRIGSLCSGYGGLDLAVEAVFGAETVAHCEWEAAPSKVLAHRWPGVPNLHDVKTADWSQVDAEILTAGYPCQPFSHAGRRKGTDDERHLWPHVAEAIRRIRPRLVVLENVAGHRSLGFGDVLGELAADGYDAQWTSLRAADVGAPHNRERVFIVASLADRGGRQRGTEADSSGRQDGSGSRAAIAGPGADPAADSDHPTNYRQRPRSESRSGGTTAADATDVGHERGRPARDRRAGSANSDRPTPDTADGRYAVGVRRGHAAGQPEPSSDSDAAADADNDAARAGREPRHEIGRGSEPAQRDRVDWGQYEPAIRRWERRLGRLAPNPTETGAKGGQRLSPAFVEWMMGLPAGWVTAVPGISRNDQLKALGNGVVPQQAAEALRRLLPHLAACAA